MNLIKILFPYFAFCKKEVIIASFLMIVVSLLALPTPYLMKFIIDDVLTNKNFRLLNLIILLFLGIQIAKLIFSFLTGYLFDVFSQKTLTHMKKDFFHKILRLPLSFFDKNQTGYLLSRIGEVEGLNFFFSNTFVRVIIGFFEFIFSLAILIHLNWKLTIISPFFIWRQGFIPGEYGRLAGR